jgi:CheY-like chemotaxis protein
MLSLEDEHPRRILSAAWPAHPGLRVEQTHNGLQALERAFDLVPDAILTDLNIPGIDGYELTRRLKSDPRTRAIPIVAISGYAPFALEPERAGRAGCDAMLPKPCEPGEITSTLKTLIDHARERRSA